MILRLAWLAAGTALAAAADIPGLATVPRDGGGWWTRVGNDALGYPLHQAVSDDHRTGAIAAGWLGGDGEAGWSAALSYDILTDRNPSRAAPQWGPEIADPYADLAVGRRRSDQATAALGRQWSWRGWRLAGGPGLRADGDLGGADLQSATHGLLGNAQVDLPDDHAGIRWRAGAWVAADWRRALAPGWSLRLGGTAWLAEDAAAAAEAAVERAAGPAAWWFGARALAAAGDPPSATAAGTARYERGWWLHGGLRLGPLSLGTARNPGTDAVDGWISVQTRPDARPPAGGGSGELAAIVGGSLAEGRGIELRVAERIAPAWAAYVAGQVFAIDSPLIYDLGLGWQEAVAGLRWTPWPAPAGWSVRPRLDADAGVLHATAVNRGRRDVAAPRSVWTGIVRAAVGADAAGSIAGLRAAIGGELAWRQPWREVDVRYQRLTWDGRYAGPPGEIALVEAGWVAAVRLAVGFGP